MIKHSAQPRLRMNRIRSQMDRREQNITAMRLAFERYLDTGELTREHASEKEFLAAFVALQNERYRLRMRVEDYPEDSATCLAAHQVWERITA